MWKTINLEKFDSILPYNLKDEHIYLMYSVGVYCCKSRRIIKVKKHHHGMYYIVNIKDTYNVTAYHLPQYDRMKNLLFDFTKYVFYEYSDIYKLSTTTPSLSSLAFYQLSTSELEQVGNNLHFMRRISSCR